MKRFIGKNPAPLFLSLTHTFFSGYGQTFFISLFVPYFMSTFNLARSDFSLFYLAATIASALLAPFAGGWTDKKRVDHISYAMGGVLAGATLLTALTPQAWPLVPLLFLLRFSGQGMMTHISQVIMSRFFTTNRGKALSITNLGYPLSEAVLPSIAALGIGLFGWRAAYLVMAVLFILIFFPIVHRIYTKMPQLCDPLATADGEAAARHHTTRKDALRHPYLWFILPHGLLVPFVTTAFFFHNDTMESLHAWDAAWFARGLFFFALFRAGGSLFVGGLIDRWSAEKLYPFSTLPIGAGLTLLLFSNSPMVSMLFFCGAGLAVGSGANIKGALLAERYGTRYLGAIRGVMTAAMVFSTAVSPYILARFLEEGYPLTTVVRYNIYFFIIAAVLAMVGTRFFSSNARNSND
ncbi:MAG: MFS transporter [Fibrobacterota bacterium]